MFIYFMILKVIPPKLGCRNINLLMITQVKKPKFESKSSYSYFQRMEHIGKCFYSRTNFLDVEKVGKFQRRTSS